MAKKRAQVTHTARKNKLSLTKRSNIRSAKSSKSHHAGGKASKSKATKIPKGFWNRASYSAGVKAGVITDKKALKKKKQEHDVKIDSGRGTNLEDNEAEEEEEEEEDVTEDFAGEDLEYIQSIGFGSSFLGGLDENDDPSAQPSSRRKKANPSNELASYEMEPRTVSASVEDPHRRMKQLLPIKHAKGLELRWEERIEEEKQEEKDEEDNDDAVKKDLKKAEVEKPVLPAMSTVELFALRQRKLSERKHRIAGLANAVLMDPEKNIGRLKELRMMLEEKERDILISVLKLVMLSLVEVFKDIAPGYRIREWGEKAKAVELKKDTKKKRDFEENMLKQYKIFLEFLEKASKGLKKSNRQLRREQADGKVTSDLPDDTRTGLSEVATSCLCTIMTSLHHFNYRTNVISVVVSLMVNSSDKISYICCQSVRALFKTDHMGEAVLDAVRFISKLVRSRNYNVHPRILNTFLSLKIKDVNLPEEDDRMKKLVEKKEKLKQMSRTQKKHQKRLAEVEKELQATEAAENKNKRKKLHTEIIQSVFATYFRILKKASSSVLLSSVLEGLAKFAHLINIEFFDDLVTVLYTLIDTGNLKYRESLHCVLTVFQILSGQGDVLNIDPTKFYTLLYVTLPHVHSGESSPDTRLILDCTEAMIIKRHKQVTFQRVLAFLKRLATFSLLMLPNGILGYCCTIRGIMKWYPRSDLLLDNDNLGSGSYLAELPEPEHCNAQNTTLWELHQLKRHYHPKVQMYAKHIMIGNPLNGAGALPLDISRMSSQQLCKQYNPDAMIFNPPINTKRVKRKHVNLISPGSDYIQKDFEDLILNYTRKTVELNSVEADFYSQGRQATAANQEDSLASGRKRKLESGQQEKKRIKQSYRKRGQKVTKERGLVQRRTLQKRNGQCVNG